MFLIMVFDDLDKQILIEVYRYRFVTAPIVSHLKNMSIRAWQKRLKRLFDSGYLDKPVKQMWDYERNKHLIYALGQKGADYLVAHYGVSFPKTVKWKEKNKRFKGNDPFSHALETACFMTSIEEGAKKRDLILLHQDELVSKNYIEGFSWRTRIYMEFEVLNVGIRPDGIFSLFSKDRSDGLNFFLEVDRATMPVHSSHLSRSSIYKKCLSYADTYKRDLAKDELNFKNFRVLFLTTTKARKLSMMVLCQERFKELPNLFLFSSMEEQKGDSFASWCTASGGLVELV